MCDTDLTYLSLFRGDDTAFGDGSGFEFVIDTPTDSMTNMAIIFTFLDISRTITSFTRVSEKKYSFTVQFTKDETKAMPLCFQKATIVMRETVTSGDETSYRYRTLTNDCLIHVTNDVGEVYDATQGSYEIQVQPGSIRGSLVGIILDLNASLEDRMNALAQIVTRGSGTVVAKDDTIDDDDGQ